MNGKRSGKHTAVIAFTFYRCRISTCVYKARHIPSKSIIGVLCKRFRAVHHGDGRFVRRAVVSNFRKVDADFTIRNHFGRDHVIFRCRTLIIALARNCYGVGICIHKVRFVPSKGVILVENKRFAVHHYADFGALCCAVVFYQIVGKGYIAHRNPARLHGEAAYRKVVYRGIIIPFRCAYFNGIFACFYDFRRCYAVLIDNSRNIAHTYDIVPNRCRSRLLFAVIGKVRRGSDYKIRRLGGCFFYGKAQRNCADIVEVFGNRCYAYVYVIGVGGRARFFLDVIVRINDFVRGNCFARVYTARSLDKAELRRFTVRTIRASFRNRIIIIIRRSISCAVGIYPFACGCVRKVMRNA